MSENKIGELDGQVAVVTGASGGIGRAICLELAKKGADVAVNYHSNQEEAEEVQKQIRAMGRHCIVVKADVSDVGELRSLFERVVSELGRVDILVNNAGIQGNTSLLDTEEDGYELVMGVNLKGAFFATKFAARQMIKQGDGGRIVNVSSVHEEWAMPGNAVYCLSKGGMGMLTKNSGVELAEHGILVVGVAPGAIATPINEDVRENDEKREALESAIPLGRIGKPEEVGRLVASLVGEAGSYMTATTVFVGGGILERSMGL